MRIGTALPRACLRGFLLLMGVPLMVSPGCHRPHAPATWGRRQPVRAIWVTRKDYRTPGDIRAIMDNCQRAGFNTVLFQVRGAGTVFYPSRFEPWAPDLGGKDPGFDPLALACKEARQRGLSLHAWVNLMPACEGRQPPADRRQLYHTHPEWFLRDAQNRMQPFGWYLSLNPAFPEVREHLVAVCREVVARYPVDGLHLDYVRIPNDWHEGFNALGAVPDYPRDPRTLRMYREETGKSPDDDPATWRNWRASRVNILVKAIHEAVRRARPGVVMTAAVGADPDHAFNAHYQDARRWLSRGWVDGVFTMNYTASMSEFEQRCAKWHPFQSRAMIATGIMVDKRPPELVNTQIQSAVAHTGHIAAFAYNSLFERLDAQGRPQTDDQSTSRQELRAGVIPTVRQLAGRSRAASPLAAASP